MQDNLTHLQKVALKGEVAYTVSTASHDAELKYRIYLILKEVEENYKPFLIQAFKEAVTFNEDIIDQLYFETLLGEVPVWLWIERNISDIKTSISLVSGEGQGVRLSINKKEERKKIVESSFIRFARKALTISPEACEQLFDKILEDYELDFLHTSCYYLKSCCAEVRDMGFVSDNASEEIFECTFDIRDLISLRAETETLNLMNKKYKKKTSKITESKKGTQPKKEKFEKVIEINSNLSQKELSDYISERVAELFKEVSTVSKTSNIQYVVKKVFNNTDISTDIKTCQTREEAEAFIAKVKETYPELQRTCNFIVCRTENNGEKG